MSKITSYFLILWRSLYTSGIVFWMMLELASKAIQVDMGGDGDF